MKERFVILGSENYNSHIDIWHKANSIYKEKILLFYDFLITLYDFVDTTYMGQDIMINEDDQIKHFRWAFNKTVGLFKKENILFREDGKHFDYFLNLFLDAYYQSLLDEGKSNLRNYIDKIFDVNNKKTSSELDILAEFYKLLNQSLKK